MAVLSSPQLDSCLSKHDLAWWEQQSSQVLQEGLAQWVLKDFRTAANFSQGRAILEAFAKQAQNGQTSWSQVSNIVSGAWMQCLQSYNRAPTKNTEQWLETMWEMLPDAYRLHAMVQAQTYLCNKKSFSWVEKRMPEFTSPKDCCLLGQVMLMKLQKNSNKSRDLLRRRCQIMNAMLAYVDSPASIHLLKAVPKMIRSFWWNKNGFKDVPQDPAVDEMLTRLTQRALVVNHGLHQADVLAPLVSLLWDLRPSLVAPMIERCLSDPTHKDVAHATYNAYLFKRQPLSLERAFQLCHEEPLRSLLLLSPAHAWESELMRTALGNFFCFPWKTPSSDKTRILNDFCRLLEQAPDQGHAFWTALSDATSSSTHAMDPFLTACVQSHMLISHLADLSSASAPSLPRKM